MKDAVILTDVDGVLLNYVYGFDQWVRRHNIQQVPGTDHEWHFGRRYGIDTDRSHALIREFNESASAGFLPPLRDAIKYVRKLHEEHGYVFHAISSFGDDIHSVRLRQENLERLFGKGVFESLQCLPLGKPKAEVLAKYKDTECWWIEDHTGNAIAGQELGLRSVLVNHSYNLADEFSGPRVQGWREIYDMVTGQ